MVMWAHIHAGDIIFVYIRLQFPLSLPLTRYNDNEPTVLGHRIVFSFFILVPKDFFIFFLQKLRVKEFPLTSNGGETSVYQIALTSGPFLLAHHSAEGT